MEQSLADKIKLGGLLALDAVLRFAKLEVWAIVATSILGILPPPFNVALGSLFIAHTAARLVIPRKVLNNWNGGEANYKAHGRTWRFFHPKPFFANPLPSFWMGHAKQLRRTIMQPPHPMPVVNTGTTAALVGHGLGREPMQPTAPAIAPAMASVMTPSASGRKPPSPLILDATLAPVTAAKATSPTVQIHHVVFPNNGFETAKGTPIPLHQYSAKGKPNLYVFVMPEGEQGFPLKRLKEFLHTSKMEGKIHTGEVAVVENGMAQCYEIEEGDHLSRLRPRQFSTLEMLAKEKMAGIVPEAQVAPTFADGVPLPEAPPPDMDWAVNDNEVPPSDWDAPPSNWDTPPSDSEAPHIDLDPGIWGF